MAEIAFHVLLAGVLSAVAGLILQLIGRAVSSRFGAEDTKDLAAIAGIRIAAVFGIAVALVFSTAHTYYNETRRDLIEEVRLIGTLFFIAKNAPQVQGAQDLAPKLVQYTRALAKEVDQPQTADESAPATSRLLLDICLVSVSRPGETASAAWLRTQIQAACSKLVDLRGKIRIRMLISNTEIPFWIFFGLAFVFLAVLFGVFERRPINFMVSTLFFFVAGVTALLIYWMSDPFHGPSRIASTPFAQLIARMEAPDGRP